jgi:hypothetical protein
MNIEDLKSACKVLGLNHEEFVSVPEIEKGVTDYKAAYEQQKMLNEKILSNIGEIAKSFDSKLESFQKDFNEGLEGKIEELSKSFNTLKEDVNGMKNTPMRNAKSAKSVTVLEKAVNGGGNNGMKTLNLNVPSDVRQLKDFLSQKAIEQLSKGVENGVYERASLQLDASRKISPDLVKKIMEQDKISIQ